MDRYTHLDHLLSSIFKYYPDAKVTVADQSKEIQPSVYDPYNVKVLPLPYDCGLSHARNTLVAETTEPYLLLLEDDFLFTENTKIENMLTLTDKADIVGGAVYRKDYRIPFEHYFEIKDGVLRHVPDGDHWTEYKGITYKPTGCILNFALFRRQVFDDIMWNRELKLREHQEFFYRARHKDIVFTPDVSIADNKGRQSNAYKKLKARDEFYIPMMESLGIHRIEYLSGQVVELKDGKIVRS